MEGEEVRDSRELQESYSPEAGLSNLKSSGVFRFQK